MKAVAYNKKYILYFLCVINNVLHKLNVFFMSKWTIFKMVMTLNIIIKYFAKEKFLILKAIACKIRIPYTNIPYKLKNFYIYLFTLKISKLIIIIYLSLNSLLCVFQRLVTCIIITKYLKILKQIHLQRKQILFQQIEKMILRF